MKSIAQAYDSWIASKASKAKGIAIPVIEFDELNEEDDTIARISKGNREPSTSEKHKTEFLFNVPKQQNNRYSDPGKKEHTNSLPRPVTIASSPIEGMLSKRNTDKQPAMINSQPILAVVTPSNDIKNPAITKTPKASGINEVQSKCQRNVENETSSDNSKSATILMAKKLSMEYAEGLKSPLKHVSTAAKSPKRSPLPNSFASSFIIQSDAKESKFAVEHNRSATAEPFPRAMLKPVAKKNGSAVPVRNERPEALEVFDKLKRLKEERAVVNEKVDITSPRSSKSNFSESRKASFTHNFQNSDISQLRGNRLSMVTAPKTETPSSTIPSTRKDVTEPVVYKKPLPPTKPTSLISIPKQTSLGPTSPNSLKQKILEAEMRDNAAREQATKLKELKRSNSMKVKPPISVKPDYLKHPTILTKENNASQTAHSRTSSTTSTNTTHYAVKKPVKSIKIIQVIREEGEGAAKEDVNYNFLC